MPTRQYLLIYNEVLTSEFVVTSSSKNHLTSISSSSLNCLSTMTRRSISFHLLSFSSPQRSTSSIKLQAKKSLFVLWLFSCLPVITHCDRAFNFLREPCYNPSMTQSLRIGYVSAIYHGSMTRLLQTSVASKV